jgi:MYXO-CTERM domain-containing protein
MFVSGKRQMRMRTAPIRLGIFTFGLALTSLASMESTALAYCRTSTSEQPANFDSTESGCWPGEGKGAARDKNGREAVPLWWRNACVGYSINDQGSRNIAPNVAAATLSLAFTRWTGATCQTSGNGRSRASIDVRYLGEVACNKVEFNNIGGPNQNVIVFRDDSWPENLKGVLGLTKTTFNPDTGELLNADIEFNTFEMEPLISDPDQKVPMPGYDFLSVATHEAGHFFGMAHSDVPGATMFASYNHEKGQTSLRNLAPDDILGICDVYNPDGNRTVRVRDATGTAVKKEFGSPQCDPTPRNGYTTQCKEEPGCGASTSPSKPAGPFAWASLLAMALVLGRRLRRR